VCGCETTSDSNCLPRPSPYRIAHPRTAALLDGSSLRPYRARVTNTSRSYFYGFFYYGFPLAGRDWRRTRE
jgi:hypothetical protein